MKALLIFFTFNKHKIRHYFQFFQIRPLLNDFPSHYDMIQNLYDLYSYQEDWDEEGSVMCTEQGLQLNPLTG